MTNYLGNLCGVAHVRGAALFSDAGFCVEDRLPPPYEPTYVQQITSQLLKGTESFSFVGSTPIATAYARASGGFLALLCTEGFHALAIAAPEVDLRSIEVAFASLRQHLRTLDPWEISGTDSEPSESESLAVTEAPRVVKVREDVLFRLATAFTDFAGPAARLIVRDEIRRGGHSSTSLPESELEGLVERLVEKLGEERERKAFLRKLRRLGVL